MEQLQKTQQTSAASDSELTKRIMPSILRAPSAHNTQPWKLTIRDGALDIIFDSTRALAVSDPAHREAYISLGCATENARIAGEYWGYRVTVDLVAEGLNKRAATLTFESANGNGSDTNSDYLFKAIPERHTDRALYDGKPLTDEEKDQLPTLSESGVITVTERKQINKIAALTEQGNDRSLARPDFKQELSRWVRNSWTRQPDGMPGFALGMPALVSLVAPIMVRIAPIHKKQAPQTSREIATASLIAVITTPNDTPRDWLHAGRLLERLWLEVTAANLSAAPLAASIESGDDIRQELKQALNTNQHPQVVFRIGHTAKPAWRPTPRRTLQDCLA